MLRKHQHLSDLNLRRHKNMSVNATQKNVSRLADHHMTFLKKLCGMKRNQHHLFKRHFSHNCFISRYYTQHIHIRWHLLHNLKPECSKFNAITFRHGQFQAVSASSSSTPQTASPGVSPMASPSLLRSFSGPDAFPVHLEKRITLKRSQNNLGICLVWLSVITLL